MKAKIKATKTRKSRARGEKVEPRSGKVFADLGFHCKGAITRKVSYARYDRLVIASLAVHSIT